MQSEWHLNSDFAFVYFNFTIKTALKINSNYFFMSAFIKKDYYFLTILKIIYCFKSNFIPIANNFFYY